MLDRLFQINGKYLVCLLSYPQKMFAQGLIIQDFTAITNNQAYHHFGNTYSLSANCFLDVRKLGRNLSALT